MVPNFDAMAEIRKHPGISLGTVAAVALGVAAAVYLSQRSGPTRYERIRQRMDPRGWVDTDSLSDRFHDAIDSFRHGAGNFAHKATDRAADYADDARDAVEDLYHKARNYRGWGRSKSALKRHGETARRYADEATDYARDHAREGGAILAVATVAALIGAAVLESQRPDSRVRKYINL